MKHVNFEAHHSKLFRHQFGIHLRHGLDIRIMLHRYSQERQCDGHKDFQFKLIENNRCIHTWIQRPSIGHPNGSLYFSLYDNKSIPIGRYALTVNAFCSEKQVHLCDVNVMFNPWLNHDVDQKLTKERTPRPNLMASNDSITSEYIDNNFGFIWAGEQVAIPWNYGINSQVVIDAKNALTQMMSRLERSDPLLYSRTLTQLIGRDVLYGRWDGYYDDGVEPTQWVGSEAILKRWIQTRRPVRYAQCWVFAAILTTILRASGSYPCSYCDNLWKPP